MLETRITPAKVILGRRRGKESEDLFKKKTLSAKVVLLLRSNDSASSVPW